MEGRLGLKDVLIFGALALLCVLVLLSMVQEDRRWSAVERLGESLERQERLLGALEQRLDASDPPPLNATRQQPDTSWAHPDAGPVVELAPLGFDSDPRSDPEHRVGGTLSVAFRGRLVTLTPFHRIDAYTRQVVDDLVCEQLAQFDARTLELRGVLARAYQLSPDGLRLRVLLDDRARFSDGTPLTAEDVRFTVHGYARNPDIAAPVLRANIEGIERVRVISPSVVEFEFAEPRFDNLTTALRLSVLPRHYYSRWSAEELNGSTGLLMGSGPYMMSGVSGTTQWRPPQDVVLRRNQQYWRGDLGGSFDEIRVTVIRDNAARLAAFEDGLVDVIRATPSQWERSEQQDSGGLAQRFQWTNMRSGYAFIAWNCEGRGETPGLFSDTRVRRAMTHLLDRRRMLRDFYGGTGSVATGPFASSSPQSDQSLEPIAHDPAAAAALLEEAGWVDRDGDGLREDASGRPCAFEFMHATASSVGPRLGAYLQDQCARVGVRCTVVPADFSSLLAARDSGDFDAFSLQLSWAQPESDPYYLWHSDAIGSTNFTRWSDPRADKLIEAGRSTLDHAARMEIWHELHGVIQDGQPCTFTAEVPWIRFVSPGIANVHPYARGFDVLEWYERVQD